VAGARVSPDLEVTEVGDDGPLVVLVHGALGSGRSFDRVAAHLVPGCRVVHYDRRGYGTNANADGVPVGVDRHIDDVLEIVDGRQALVVGHSFGGVTAIGAAVRAPELVRSVAVWETSLAWIPEWDDTVMRGILGGADPPDAALRMMLGERYVGMDDAERERRLVDARAFVAEERSVRTGTPPYDVAALRVPLVYGRSDVRVMPVVTAFLARTVADLELVTVPGAGHHAHRAAPDAFADIVRRALGRSALEDPVS
jgi:pimeloyl-ACP methyl ester carboxylesterase